VFLFVVLIGAAGYSAVRYFIDKGNYSKAHQAYLQADCTTAIRHFDSIINAWRLVDLGKYSAFASHEKEECVPFQAALDRQQAGDLSQALIAYTDFVTNVSGSALVGAARDQIASLFELASPYALASPESCAILDTLLNNSLIPQQNIYLPPFYMACGQTFDTADDQESSFPLYLSLIKEYPNHPLVVDAVAALLENPVACEEFESLKKIDVIANQTEFMPRLYINCGQAFEDSLDWTNAIRMYEIFLTDFPEHFLASDVETALARAIVAQAKMSGAGEIPLPERSGSASRGTAEVTIQNDSPERLRIVFSGPESHVEELEACSSCITYSGIGPLYCPEKGPIGKYVLTPGQYDVVVESITDSGVTDWTGNWDLPDGDEYYSCFIIVTTFGPR
jgi:hypothetical protein